MRNRSSGITRERLKLSEKQRGGRSGLLTFWTRPHSRAGFPRPRKGRDYKVIRIHAEAINKSASAQHEYL